MSQKPTLFCSGRLLKRTKIKNEIFCLKKKVIFLSRVSLAPLAGLAGIERRFLLVICFFVRKRQKVLFDVKFCPVLTRCQPGKGSGFRRPPSSKILNFQWYLTLSLCQVSEGSNGKLILERQWWTWLHHCRTTVVSTECFPRFIHEGHGVVASNPGWIRYMLKQTGLQVGPSQFE